MPPTTPQFDAYAAAQDQAQKVYDLATQPAQDAYDAAVARSAKVRNAIYAAADADFDASLVQPLADLRDAQTQAMQDYITHVQPALDAYTAAAAANVGP